MWLVLALAMGLGALAGAAEPVSASQTTGGQDDLFLEEGESYEMKVWVANCQIVPPMPPVLDGAGCVPPVGAFVEFIADDGTSLGSCTANAVIPTGDAATCSVFIPLSTRGQAHLDTSTIGAFAPQRNPIPFGSPGPGPIEGLVGFPIFVNLPTAGPGQPDQSGQPQQPQQPQQP
jgi:hypothetical protein